MAFPRDLKERAVDQLARRRVVRRTGDSPGPPDFREGMFAKQVELYNCTAARLYALLGRRWGKTAAFGRKAAQICITIPKARVIYTARSLRNAKKIIFPELVALRDRYGVPIRFRRSNDDVTASFPGDSEIIFMGIKTQDRIDDLRGFGHDVQLIGLDEMGTYIDWLEELVERGAHPLTGDCGGQMWLMGTCGKVMSGYWYEKTRLDHAHNYPVFRGTALENPYLQGGGLDERGINPKIEAWLAEYRRDNGISEDDPEYRQEWLAEWCQNVDALIFDYDSARNGVTELPPMPGLDIGAPDAPDWGSILLDA